MEYRTERRLGAIEYCWVRMDDYAPVNFVGVLHLSRAPEKDALAGALRTLQARHPYLRASVGTARRGYHYRLHPTPPEIPLTCLPRDGDAHWRRLVEAELATPFDTAQPPLARVSLLQGADAADLILTFHHAIIDSRSGEALFHELLGLLGGAAPGGQAPQTALLPPLDALFPPEFRGLSKLRRLAGFLARQMRDELRYRRALAGRQPIHATGPVRPRVLCLELDPDVTKHLTRAARRRRLPLNAVLHAAMLLALARAKYPAARLPMRGISFADLRPYLQPPPPPARMGVYITMLQYNVAMTPDAGLWGLAEAVSAQIYAAAKSTDKFAAALISRRLIDFLLARRSMRMGMVALSYPGPLTIPPAYGDIGVTGLSGFIGNNPLGPELAGFGKILNGRLSLDLQYLESDMDRDTARTIRDDIRTALTVGEGSE